MKKVILVAATVLVGGFYVSGATFAENKTEGKVQYKDGALVINPDLTDPTDPKKSIDPETGTSETPQPGGNINHRLPGNLNFGYHVNQTTKAETWLAKNVDTSKGPDFDALATAYQSADKTVGALLVEDNRTAFGEWEIKVKQAGEFKIAAEPAASLGLTNLVISTGNIWNNVTSDLTGITAPNKTVNLASTGTEVSILNAVPGKGAGMTKLNLTEFKLEIPKNTVKKAAVYTADLNWTVSKAP